MTAHPFLITGQPRARTAWLSVFCTTGESLCYHEPSADALADIPDLERLYRSEFYKYVGVSDSGMGFHLPWIMEHIKPRTVIVDRDPKEVNESLVQLGFPSTNYCEILRDRLMEFRHHPLVLWVPYEALNKKRVMQKLFWHLMPGAAFDESRYDLLAKMIIEIDPKLAVQRFLANRERIATFTRDVTPLIKLEGHGDATVH